MREFEFDPIQKIATEKLRSLGIEAVLFDLDDTLIYTGDLFKRFMEEYVEVVSASLGVEAQILQKRIQELNDEEYFKMGVAPERWKTVLSRLSEELNDKGEVMGNLDIIMMIYKEEPAIRPGAKAILGGLRDSGFKLGLVTHASTEWTMRKLIQTDLLNYFETITIADENGSKTIEHWKKGVESLGVEANKCLVVGDNVKGDIIPATTLGTRAIVLPSHWSVYREGVVPQGVVKMEELSDFWEAVLKLS